MTPAHMTHRPLFTTAPCVACMAERSRSERHRIFREYLAHHHPRYEDERATLRAIVDAPADDPLGDMSDWLRLRGLPAGAQDHDRTVMPPSSGIEDGELPSDVDGPWYNDHYDAPNGALWAWLLRSKDAWRSGRWEETTAADCFAANYGDGASRLERQEGIGAFDNASLDYKLGSVTL